MLQLEMKLLLLKLMNLAMPKAGPDGMSNLMVKNLC